MYMYMYEGEQGRERLGVEVRKKGKNDEGGRKVMMVEDEEEG